MRSPNSMSGPHARRRSSCENLRTGLQDFVRTYNLLNSYAGMRLPQRPKNGHGLLTLARDACMLHLWRAVNANTHTHREGRDFIERSRAYKRRSGQSDVAKGTRRRTRWRGSDRYFLFRFVSSSMVRTHCTCAGLSACKGTVESTRRLSQSMHRAAQASASCRRTIAASLSAIVSAVGAGAPSRASHMGWKDGRNGFVALSLSSSKLQSPNTSLLFHFAAAAAAAMREATYTFGARASRPRASAGQPRSAAPTY